MNPQDQLPIQPQPPHQQQAPLPPPHQPMPIKNKRIVTIIFGVLALIVVASIIFGATQNKDKKQAPVSIIPGVNSAQLKARDTERETDIKAMHGQVEAFWAQNGYYPSFANLNDTTFIDKNLKGLDKGALQDPLGTDTILVSSPEANAYSYEVLPANCDNAKTYCQSYTLTATLEGAVNGVSTYEKRSLNE